MPAISFDSFSAWLSIWVGLGALALLSVGIIPNKLVERAERLTRSFARREKLILVLIPVASLLLNVSFALKNGVPRVRVQDEFSYLLAADTFAHYRLTNPTPECSEHFETPHELMRPTYMSKYPPGQGLALALGQLLTTKPIVGVWLTTAAACTAIYWMLLGFESRTWAMVGGFVAVTHPMVLQWSQIYWGGSVAALGGAIVLGAWIRLMLKISRMPIIALGFGLAILANSRPYEGLVLVVPLTLALVWKHRSSTWRIGAWLLAVLLPVAVLMGYYNFRVTGHPLRMPFMEYANQYDVFPKFWFLPKRPVPVYGNQTMEAIHTIFERGDYDTCRTAAGIVQVCAERSWKLIAVNAQPWVLMLPLLMAIPFFKDRTIRWVWFTVMVFLAGLLAENFFLEHYSAPIFAGLILLIVKGWERLASITRRGKPLGRTLARAVAIGFIAGAGYHVIAPPNFATGDVGQQALIDQSKNLQSGRHLIFVQYGPGHLMHDEWVYNQADLEGSGIIWARCMGKLADAPVAAHYSGREIWLLTVGRNDLDLRLYPLR